MYEILVFRIGDPPVVEPIDSFEDIKSIVGGYLEHIKAIDVPPGVMCLADEDGILRQLDTNRTFRTIYGPYLPLVWASCFRRVGRYEQDAIDDC